MGTRCMCYMGDPKTPHGVNPKCTIHAETAPVDMVNAPPHYNSHPSGVECIDIARHLTGDWFNAFKYVFRAEHKNGLQDIEKGEFYAKDSLKHDIPMHSPTWTVREDALLGRVIDAETGERRRFFYAVKLGAREKALRHIEAILMEWPDA